MTKQEQINEMYNTLKHKGLIEFDEENVKTLYDAGYRKVGENEIVISKEEYSEMEANYDKVYKQAEADILANISDGGTSCYWCIAEREKRAKKEVAKEILQDFSYILELIKNNDDAKVILNHIKKKENEYGIKVE